MADSTLIIVQLAFIAIILLMGLTFGIMPTKIPWWKNSMSVLGIANAFSGGVFLAIAFLHVLPEVAHQYADYMDPHHHDEYNSNPIYQGLIKNQNLRHGDGEEYFPLPFALAFLGYAFILLIDKVVFDTHSLVGEHHHGHAHDPVQESFIQNAKSSFIKFKKIASGEVNAQKHENGETCDDPSCWINESQINENIKSYLSRNDKFAVRMSVALRKNPYNKMTSKTFAHNAKGLDDNDDQVALFADKNNIDFRDTTHNHGHEHGHDHDHDHDHHGKARWWTWNLTPVVLMIALSTHAIFEGIAVGVVSDLKDFWTLAIAIAAHKWWEAMSLGISMSKNFKDENKTIYILLLIFSWATPLGVSIGMLVSGSSVLTNIIFFSLTAGTFTYIAWSEVIVEEFSTPDNKWFKMLFFLIGAGVILSLNFIEGA